MILIVVVLEFLKQVWGEYLSLELFNSWYGNKSLTSKTFIQKKKPLL